MDISDFKSPMEFWECAAKDFAVFVSEHSRLFGLDDSYISVSKNYDENFITNNDSRMILSFIGASKEGKVMTTIIAIPFHEMISCMSNGEMKIENWNIDKTCEQYASLFKLSKKTVGQFVLETI